MVQQLFEKLNGTGRRRQWLLFLGAAFAALLVLSVPFLLRGNHFIWAVQERDGATQGLTFLQNLRDTGWFGAVGSFDFTLGLGADYLTCMSFTSLFDPFNVFVFLLPFDVVWVYDVIVVLKFLAAGGAMLFYLQHRRVRGGYAVCLALLYMLSGYVVFTFFRHLSLTSGAILLPLMVFGLERVYARRQPFFFIAVSFLCLLNSFYMFFFNSVFLVLYAFLYHGEVCRAEGTPYAKTLLPRLWRVAAFYALAIALAAFMLLPAVYAYLQAARGGSKGMNWQSVLTYFLELLSFIGPSEGGNYSPLMLCAFSFVMGVCAFFLCGKRGWALRVASLVLSVGFLVPLFGYAMNLFNYSNNRWVYLLSFSIFAMIGVSTTLPHGEEPYPVPLRRRAAKVLSVYAAALVVLGGASLIVFLAGSSLSTAAVGCLCALTAPVMAAAVALCVWALSKRSFLRDRGTPAQPPRILDGKAARLFARPAVLAPASVLLALVCALCFCSVYSADHRGAAEYRTLFSEEEAYLASLSEESFFRADVQAAETWWENYTNRGMNNGYRSTVLYHTMGSGETYTFLGENQVYNPTQTLGMAGLDDRAALQTLLSCRYYYAPQGPYYADGFSQAEGFSSLYENKYGAPFGFVYKNTLSRAYYDSLDPLLRQYAMLEGMVVEGQGTQAEAEGLGGLETLAASDAAFTVTAGEEMCLSLSGCAGKEVYLRLWGAAEVSEKAELRIEGNGKVRTYRFTPYGTNMYSTCRDVCICLGVPEEDTIEVVLTMVRGSALSFASWEGRAYAVDAYRTAAEALVQAEHLEEVTFSGNTLGGTIRTDGGWMFFSVPYSKGWRAEVDGQPVPIVRANGSFMAIELEAGEHTVSLVYETPYFALGAWVSLGACAALAALIVVYAVFAARRARKSAP